MNITITKNDKMYFHPAYHIMEWLVHEHVKLKNSNELAEKLGLTKLELLDLLMGEYDVDDSLADKLSELIKTTPEFWKNLQKNFNKGLKK